MQTTSKTQYRQVVDVLDYDKFAELTVNDLSAQDIGMWCTVIGDFSIETFQLDEIRFICGNSRTIVRLFANNDSSSKEYHPNQKCYISISKPELTGHGIYIEKEK